jgi:hypothetical protein
MDATVQLPEALAHRIEKLAEQEGTGMVGLLGRLVSEHVERRGTVSVQRLMPRKDVQFPLIPKAETGVIRPITGSYMDEMFTSDDLAS